MKKRGYGDHVFIANRAIEFKIEPSNARFILHASIETKLNKELMIELINRDPSAFRYIDPVSIRDKDVIMVACKKNMRLISYAIGWKSDREFILLILNTLNNEGKSITYYIYHNLDPVLKSDPEIIPKIIRQYAKNIKLYPYILIN